MLWLAMDPLARRLTLIAESRVSGVYSFYVKLQGRDETVFFDLRIASRTEQRTAAQLKLTTLG